MTRPFRRYITATVVVVLLLFTGACNGDSAGTDQPVGGGKETSLPVRSPDAVVKEVSALAARIPNAVGSSQPLSDDEPRVSPCSDPAGNASEDGPFSVQGTYRILLPGAQHRAAFQGLRDQWSAAGWTDVKYREFDPENVRAELSGVSPDEKFDVTLTSAMAPVKSLRLLIGTPCYQRASTST